MMATKQKDPEEQSTTTTPAVDPPAITGKRSKADAVADLERRLKLLEDFGPAESKTNPAAAAMGTTPATASSVVPDAPATTPAKPVTGKNALLVSFVINLYKEKDNERE